MQAYPPTVVWRHRKENLKKCSLSGLESRVDFRFYSFPNQSLPDIQGYILLDINGPPITPEDNLRGILVLDATWRYANLMLKAIPEKTKIERRSLPLGFRTAYPRRQEDCPDPERGLASIEAIYAAYSLMGRSTEGLFERYYWKSLFFERNSFLI